MSNSCNEQALPAAAAGPRGGRGDRARSREQYCEAPASPPELGLPVRTRAGNRTWR